MILLGFKIEGKTPSEKEILNSSVNWLEISLLNFKIFVGILTGFRWLRHKMIFLISVLWTGFMKKEVMSISGRNLLNLFLENLIIDQMVLEIFTKYLLNTIRTSFSLVKFAITVEGTEFEVLLFWSFCIEIIFKHVWNVFNISNRMLFY